MAQKEKFQKEQLNKDDHKAKKGGAKAVKRFLGTLGAVALVVANKDNLKKALSVATDLIKR